MSPDEHLPTLPDGIKLQANWVSMILKHHYFGKVGCRNILHKRLQLSAKRVYKSNK